MNPNKFTPHLTIEFLSKYSYKGKCLYFTYLEGDQYNYGPLLMKIAEEHPEWELVQVFQRIELRQSQSRIVGGDGNNPGHQAIQIFTPLFKTEVKNYEKLPEQIKQNLCATMAHLRANNSE